MIHCVSQYQCQVCLNQHFFFEKKGNTQLYLVTTGSRLPVYAKWMLFQQVWLSKLHCNPTWKVWQRKYIMMRWVHAVNAGYCIYYVLFFMRTICSCKTPAMLLMFQVT